MTAHKMQIKKRPRSPKRSGRKSDELLLVTTELEPREDLQVRTVVEPCTGVDRPKGKR
jgi:hypothetical protein